MGCKCTAISRCRSDINKISSGVVRLDSALQTAYTMKQKLAVIADLSESGLFAKNIYELSSEIQELAQPVDKGILEVKSDFNSEKNRITSLRTRYSREDSAYHAAQ